MNNTIRTFADYDVCDSNPIGYEAAPPQEVILGITEEDASNFEAACEEVDYDALREAEADDAWNNLKECC